MKKQFTILTCVALALSMIAGCASNSSAPASSAASSASQAASSAASSETASAPAESAPETVVGETVSIENAGHIIPGILTMPENIPEGETVPAVLMLHGTASDKNEAGGGYVLMADAFAKAGVASLRIDFMGAGDSTVDYASYCNTTAVSDANAAGRFLSQQPGINPERIGIMGWSQGGTDALLTAAQSDLFKSVLTWAGALDLSTLMTDEMYQQAQADGYAVMEFDWREPLHLGLQWMDEVKNTDMNAVVAQIKAPIMAINGSADDVVPPESGKTIKELSTNEASEYVVLEGGDHTFGIFGDDHTVFDELMAKTTEWFANTL